MGGSARSAVGTGFDMCTQPVKRKELLAYYPVLLDWGGTKGSFWWYKGAILTVASGVDQNGVRGGYDGFVPGPACLHMSSCFLQVSICCLGRVQSCLHCMLHCLESI